MGVLYLSLFLIVLDQLTKFWIKGISIPLLGIHLSGIPYGGSINVLGSFLQITFVENPGMAFGITVGVTSKLFLSLFSLFASIALIYYLYRMRNKPLFYRISLSLIIAGAVGNLIDRTFYGIIYGYAPIFYGKVVDFISCDFPNFSLFGHYYDRFPIFNIADSSVTIGVILLLIFHSFSSKKKKNEENEESGANSELKETEGKAIGAAHLKPEMGAEADGEFNKQQTN